jgi:hypothetical protein
MIDFPAVNVTVCPESIEESITVIVLQAVTSSDADQTHPLIVSSQGHPQLH